MPFNTEAPNRPSLCCSPGLWGDILRQQEALRGRVERWAAERLGTDVLPRWLHLRGAVAGEQAQRAGDAAAA